MAESSTAWALLDWMLTVTHLDKESMRPILVNLGYQTSWCSENSFPRRRQIGIAPHWAAMKGGMTPGDFPALPRASARDLLGRPKPLVVLKSRSTDDDFW